jgi:uncharacterized protein YdbL (DUF1318 family)
MRANFCTVIVAFVAASCITVNIYFPAPEVRQAAEEIVEETWGPESPRPQATQQSSWWRLFEPARAQAQEADINVSTAAIRALKESMRNRAEQLKPFLAAGRLGVGRDGMLAIRSLEGVPLSEQATIRRLVEAENRDRASLYREIAEANEFGKDRIPDIQRIFAETWIDKAEKGWPIQEPDGTWQTK